jgi:hypothetical protein
MWTLSILLSAFVTFKLSTSNTYRWWHISGVTVGCGRGSLMPVGTALQVSCCLLPIFAPPRYWRDLFHVLPLLRCRSIPFVACCKIECSLSYCCSTNKSGCGQILCFYRPAQATIELPSTYITQMIDLACCHAWAVSLLTIVHIHLSCQSRRGPTGRLCHVRVIVRLCLLTHTSPTTGELPSGSSACSCRSVKLLKCPTHARLTHPTQQPIQQLCPSWLFVGDDGGDSYLAV